MADYSSLAVNDIRLYIWNNIKSAGLLNEQDYYADGFDQPIIPIIPAQQIPELNNLLPGKTYIVYDYEILPIDTDWWITNEVGIFMIYSTHYDEVHAILNLLVDLFRRYDDSASEISASNISSSNFQFHYTAIEKIKSPEPSKYEGGLKTGFANILYSYSRRTQDSGRY